MSGTVYDPINLKIVENSDLATLTIDDLVESKGLDAKAEGMVRGWQQSNMNSGDDFNSTRTFTKEETTAGWMGRGPLWGSIPIAEA